MIPSTSGAAASTATVLPYQWVTVGGSGALYTSTSTTLGSWTSRTSSFGTSGINAVASNGTSMYVAVGNSGKVASSPDGITWTQRTSNIGTGNITAVAYGGGYWVIVNQNGNIATSTDGITWTSRTSGTTAYLSCIRFGNGQWLAGGQSNDRYATDPTGTWTATDTLSGLAYVKYNSAQSIWTSGSDAGTTGALSSSTNVATWTARNSPSSLLQSSLSVICAWASNSSVIVMGQTGSLSVNVFLSSTDGITYTSRTGQQNGQINCAASDSNELMVIAGAGFQSSSDGITWTSRTGPGVTVSGLCHSSRAYA